MARIHGVIVNYNTAELLRRCLQHSFASVTDHQFTLTVVDNGSDDESLALVRAEFPAVATIRSERNLGFAGGNNLALRAILAERARAGEVDAVDGERRRDLELVRPQPPGLRQRFEIDQQRAARERRGRAVRRVTVAGRADGQHLPPPLLRRREKIDERRGLAAEVAAAKGPREARRMEEHAARSRAQRGRAERARGI